MDSNKANRNDFMHLHAKITDCLPGLIREHFNQVYTKYNLPELDDTYHLNFYCL